MASSGEQIIHKSTGSYEPPTGNIWAELTKHWDRYGDNLAIKEHPTRTRGTISFRELKERCVRLGEGMRKNLGLKPGDVVGVFGANSIDWMTVLWAIQFAGLRSSLANPAYQKSEIQHVFGLTEPRRVFVDEMHFDKLVDAGVPAENLILISTAQTKGRRDAESVMVSAQEARSAQPAKTGDLNEDAYYAFSSGTTGAPKAVCVSHRNVVCMMASLNKIPGLYDNTPRRQLAVLPMFHAAGLLAAMTNLQNGGALHMLIPFDPKAWPLVIQKEQIETTTLVPPLLALLNSMPLQKEHFKTLRYITCGTSPLDAGLQQRFSDKVGVQIAQGYGMTESTVGIALGLVGQLGSNGLLAPGLEARMVDPETGKDQPLGGRGELWVRGPTIVKGYYKNPKATAETILPGGWLRTGDVVSIDKDGSLFVVDRMKELIKVKGFQVAPAELEGVLKSHPKVKLAGVIGVYDHAQATEFPRAYVDLVEPLQDEGAKRKLEAEIREFVDKQVSSQKRLRAGVFIIDAVPASPTGKIVRKDLKALVAKEQKAGERQAKL